MSLHQKYVRGNVTSLQDVKPRGYTPLKDYTDLTTLELLKEFNLLLGAITRDELTSTNAIFRLSQLCFTVLMKLDTIDLEKEKELREKEKLGDII